MLLATADDAQALAGLSNGVSTRHRSSPEITFNLAVVLIISLLSVALLITGICCEFSYHIEFKLNLNIQNSKIIALNLTSNRGCLPNVKQYTIIFPNILQYVTQ